VSDCAICRETLKPGERIVCGECRSELERKVAEELRKVVRKVG